MDYDTQYDFCLVKTGQKMTKGKSKNSNSKARGGGKANQTKNDCKKNKELSPYNSKKVRSVVSKYVK